MRLDSRQVQRGDLYAAVAGVRTNGHDHAPEAVARAAAALRVSANCAWTSRFGRALGTRAEPRGSRAGRAPRPAACGSSPNGKTTEPAAARGAAGVRRRAWRHRHAGHALRHPQPPEPAHDPRGARPARSARPVRRGGSRDVVVWASSIALEQGRLDRLRFDMAVHTDVGERAPRLPRHGSSSTRNAPSA